MIPRFVNPHVLQLSTQTVSRADLEADRDVAHTEVDEDTSAMLALEHILKRTLGDFQSNHSESSQDYERQTKRKKTTRGEGGIVIRDTVDEQPVGQFIFWLYPVSSVETRVRRVPPTFQDSYTGVPEAQAYPSNHVRPFVPSRHCTDFG